MYFYRGVRKKTNPRFDFWVDVLMSCFLDFLTLKISVINSSRVQKLQNFSEEVLMMSETCLNFWGTKFGPWMDARLEKNGDFARVGRKIKINRGLFGILRNLADPLHVFL